MCKVQQVMTRETESVDESISDLYTLAKYYQYGELQDELICDRTVVSIWDI